MDLPPVCVAWERIMLGVTGLAVGQLGVVVLHEPFGIGMLPDPA